MSDIIPGCRERTNFMNMKYVDMSATNIRVITVRDVTRALIGRGGGYSYIHIFVFCPINFGQNTNI